MIKTQAYGLPYMGSKNKIAEWVIRNLPKAENLYDLFCGGCAITHIALVSGRYEHIFSNDISKFSTAFKDAVNGKFLGERRWISHEMWKKLKDTDYVARYLYFFGYNPAHSYMYGKGLRTAEAKAGHYAIYFNDFSLLKELGHRISPSIFENCKDVRDRKIALQHACPNLHLNHIECLCRVNSLTKLKPVIHKLTMSNGSYDQVPIKEGSVVYCDIPYINTEGYSVDFDHNKFYNWVRNNPNLVCISEYRAPKDFVAVAIRPHLCSMSNNGKPLDTYESIFVHESKVQMYKEMMKRR